MRKETIKVQGSVFVFSEKCKYCTDDTCVHSPKYCTSYDDYRDYGHDDWFVDAIGRAWEEDQAWRDGAFW